MTQESDKLTKIERLGDFSENINGISKISFPEVLEGYEENEGDQTLLSDKQYPPSQIFQTQPPESLISVRYCIIDNNFIPGHADK